MSCVLDATAPRALLGRFESCLTRSTVKKYRRSAADAAAEATSVSDGGGVGDVVGVGAVVVAVELGLGLGLAGGSLRSSAHDVMAASSNAAVARRGARRLVPIPAACLPRDLVRTEELFTGPGPIVQGGRRSSGLCHH